MAGSRPMPRGASPLPSFLPPRLDPLAALPRDDERAEPWLPALGDRSQILPRDFPRFLAAASASPASTPRCAGLDRVALPAGTADAGRVRTAAAPVVALGGLTGLEAPLVATLGLARAETGALPAAGDRCENPDLAERSDALDLVDPGVPAGLPVGRPPTDRGVPPPPPPDLPADRLALRSLTYAVGSKRPPPRPADDARLLPRLPTELPLDDTLPARPPAAPRPLRPRASVRERVRDGAGDGVLCRAGRLTGWAYGLPPSDLSWRVSSLTLARSLSFVSRTAATASASPSFTAAAALADDASAAPRRPPRSATSPCSRRISFRLEARSASSVASASFRAASLPASCRTASRASALALVASSRASASRTRSPWTSRCGGGRGLRGQEGRALPRAGAYAAALPAPGPAGGRRCGGLTSTRESPEPAPAPAAAARCSTSSRRRRLIVRCMLSAEGIASNARGSG